MCGIVGYWSVTPIQPESLATFADMLAHRGPDGFGYLTADNNRLGLGHRRLAILDPQPRSDQPMLSADSRYAIVFNGEIYNFLEVRDELEAKGHRFQTESDTEVILHAYREWGPDCHDKFNGMWAFAIWDNMMRKLFLSRDRFGVKPLLFLETRKGIAFASEAKAFSALSWLDATDGEGGLQGVTALGAGKCATLEGPTEPLRIRRWWNPLNYLGSAPAGYPLQVDRFRELFIDACRLRLRSDVPVGTAISGGLDSSSVLAVVNLLGSESIARRPADWSRAFTAVAPGTEHDELEYANAACKSAGVRPIVIDLFQRCDPGDIDEYLYLTEGASLTNLAAWYLYRSMREQGIRVSMDGQGADEILAGYYYDANKILQLEGSWLRRPRRTLDILRTTHALTEGSPYVPTTSKKLLLSLLVRSSPLLCRILNQTRGRRLDPPHFLGNDYDAELWQMAKTLPPLNSVLFMAVNDGIQALLQRYDLLSMSNALEIRMPFLDWRLVCFALSLPAESILGHGFTKRVLRDAMKPYLPPEVLNRKRKLQFQGPVRQLLENPLKSWMNSYGGLADTSSDVLAKGSYAQVRDLGKRVVNLWRSQTYPRLINARVTALRAHHSSNLALLERHTRTIG